MVLYTISLIALHSIFDTLILSVVLRKSSSSSLNNDVWGFFNGAFLVPNDLSAATMYDLSPLGGSISISISVWWMKN